MPSKSIIACMIIFASGLLSACEGKHPFLVVQLCLRDDRDAAQLTEVIESIARSENLRYIDRGASTQKELVRQNSSPPYKLIYFGVKGEGGIGLEGGNLGLSAYEVAIGFSEGTNSQRSHKFADAVIEAISKKWKISVVPADRGAMPMGCPDTEKK